jgi:hypothetical protein
VRTGGGSPDPGSAQAENGAGTLSLLPVFDRAPGECPAHAAWGCRWLPCCHPVAPEALPRVAA